MRYEDNKEVADIYPKLSNNSIPIGEDVLKRLQTLDNRNNIQAQTLLKNEKRKYWDNFIHHLVSKYTLKTTYMMVLVV